MHRRTNQWKAPIPVLIHRTNHHRWMERHQRGHPPVETPAQMRRTDLHQCSARVRRTNHHPAVWERQTDHHRQREQTLQTTHRQRREQKLRTTRRQRRAPRQTGLLPQKRREQTRQTTHHRPLEWHQTHLVCSVRHRIHRMQESRLARSRQTNRLPSPARSRQTILHPSPECSRRTRLHLR